MQTEIFVIFYGENSFAHLVLKILRNCLDSIEKFSDQPHKTYIVDNGSDIGVIEEIKNWGWPIIINENPDGGYSSIMNKCINSSKSDPFVTLHGDMKVTKNWLRTLLEEHKYSEDYFKRPCCLIPHFISYDTPKDDIIFTSCKGDLESYDTMSGYCKRYGFPYEPDIGVISKPPYKGKISRSATNITDDGTHLMSFIASQAFFKNLGLYDAGFTGYGWEDCDIGIRALMKGLKVLQTHDVYMHHIIAVSRGRGRRGQHVGRTWDYFIEKWGKKTFDDLESGKLWIKLHDDQIR